MKAPRTTLLLQACDDCVPRSLETVYLARSSNRSLPQKLAARAFVVQPTAAKLSRVAELHLRKNATRGAAPRRRLPASLGTLNMQRARARWRDTEPGTTPLLSRWRRNHIRDESPMPRHSLWSQVLAALATSTAPSPGSRSLSLLSRQAASRGYDEVLRAVDHKDAAASFGTEARRSARVHRKLVFECRRMLGRGGVLRPGRTPCSIASSEPRPAHDRSHVSSANDSTAATAHARAGCAARRVDSCRGAD